MRAKWRHSSPGRQEFFIYHWRPPRGTRFVELANYGETPVMRAAENDKLETVRALVAADCDPAHCWIGCGHGFQSVVTCEAFQQSAFLPVHRKVKVLYKPTIEIG